MSTPERQKRMDHLPAARTGSAWRWFLALAFTTLFLQVPEQRSTSVREHGSAHPVEQQPLALIGPTLFSQDGPDLPDLSTPDLFEEDRMTQIKEAIAKSEYHIRYQERVTCLQSPNRAQDLRVSYHPDGFSLSPRVEGDRWHTQLRLRSIGHLDHEWKPSPLATITATEHRAEADHGNFKILYENDERGMRQDFLVLEKPEGHGPLMVTMHYEGDLTVSQKGEDDILFSSIDSVGNPVSEVWYKDLLAWDANNEPLHAWASIEDDAIVLHVDDANAAYPVTIDPLSTGANWTGEGNQAGAYYGASVNTAGDVNGDGRSDIIIGAPFYDGGATNGGRVFIYHGTANGPNATANTTITSVAPEVALGVSVATAGDVNGDGFSDVVITRETYSPNSSAVFIHYGSLAGVSATPNTTITLGGVCCGTTAETAGDVNGDGYSDVIIADATWSSGRGRAYVHHGSASGLSATPTTTISGTQSASNLGQSVSSAGDVNNDGYSDVIIGQGHWTAGQQEEGRFFVHHGSAGGINATPSYTYESNQQYMFLGVSVSFAGDVDGDGYSDVIVGGPSYFDGSNTVGAAFVFYGSGAGITATGMDLTAGAVNGTSFGYSVSCAGDVNGDGYADVIIGEPGGFTTLPGAAYVYLGSGAGLGGTPVWTGGGVQASAGYGTSVAGAGDVNGDGYSDVLVGAPRKDNSGQTDEGHVMFYRGSANGLTTASGQLAETQISAQFGAAVASAGDMNADGFADLLVGAPLYDNGETNEGRVMLFLGAAGGFSSTASWTAESDQANAQFGASVGSAGDVNGDGYSDFLIGAPLFDDGEANEGRTYLYNGASGLPSTTPTWTFNGDQVDANCGRVVGPAGDVNADGYSDVLLAMPLWNGTFADEGRALVFHGSALGLGAVPAWDLTGGATSLQFGFSASFAGDTNGDGHADVIIGIPSYSSGHAGEGRVLWYPGGIGGLAATPGWAYESNSIGAAFGSSVSAAGDVNGDGEADFIVGAPTYASGQSNEGRVYVFYGNPTGPGAFPFTYESGIVNARLGTVVTMAGDVNGDGYGDVAASHVLSNGTFMCWLGSGLGVVPTADFVSSGTQTNEGQATALANAGDVDGDGFGDLAVGSPLYNAGAFGAFADAGRVRTFRGGANPTLSRVTKQYRRNLTTPVRSSNGTFETGCGFGIGHVARSWIGRRRMKLAWEVIGHGGVFQGTPMSNSVAFTGQQATWANVSSLTGTEIKEVVTIAGYSFPKWRVRVRHDPATMIDGQPFGRWHHFGVHDKQDPSAKLNLSDCGPLPVDLISFTGACDGHVIALRWMTATERDNDHFMVQRSQDGREWRTVGRVDGSGSSQQTHAYEFNDPEAENGTRYYRLVQVDIDGTEKEQPVISVVGCAPSSGVLKVWPVPASDEVHLASPWSDTFELHIVDGTGRIIRSQRLEAQQEGTAIHVDTRSLPPGQYQISCRSDVFGTLHASFIIAH